MLREAPFQSIARVENVTEVYKMMSQRNLIMNQPNKSLSKFVKLSEIENDAVAKIEGCEKTESEKSLEEQTKQLYSNPAKEKRKRLRSVRVRNALRITGREIQGNIPETQYSSTSEDSDSMCYNSNGKRRVEVRNFQETESDIVQTKLNTGQVDGAKVQKSIERREQIYVKKETQRLNYEQCSQCTDSEDSIVNSDLQGKSDSYSNSSKFDYYEGNLNNEGRTFPCPLCAAKKFRQVNLLIHHLMHGHNLDLNENDLDKLKYLILYKPNEISITATPQKFSRPFTQARYEFKRCKYRALINVDAESEQEDVEWNSKARTDGIFTCLKCRLTFGNEDAFYMHVKHDHIWTDEEIHRQIENGAEAGILEFWCPECGSEFVTKSALSMHLKGSHEFLHDIQLYLEKIGYEGEIFPMAENQCDICYGVFDGSLEFEKHVRSHGLAFLRRQQLLSKLRKIN